MRLCKLRPTKLEFESVVADVLLLVGSVLYRVGRGSKEEMPGETRSLRMEDT